MERAVGGHVQAAGSVRRRPAAGWPPRSGPPGAGGVFPGQGGGLRIPRSWRILRITRCTRRHACAPRPRFPGAAAEPVQGLPAPEQRQLETVFQQQEHGHGHVLAELRPLFSSTAIGYEGQKAARSGRSGTGPAGSAGVGQEGVGQVGDGADPVSRTMAKMSARQLTEYQTMAGTAPHQRPADHERGKGSHRCRVFQAWM